MKILEKATETASHPIGVVALIGALSTGGAGAVLWEPAKKMIESISIRHDVTIYLLCEQDPSCVNEAWDHILSRRKREAMK